MLALYQDGALRGASAAEAFQVRCDRSTMSQNDIDNGRLIAELQFQAAVPIEHVTVQLALDASGQVSLVPRSLAALEVA
jgi:phage tail sheath protein FI